MAKQDVFDEVQARKEELEALGLTVPEKIEDATVPELNELLDKLQEPSGEDEENGSVDGDGDGESKASDSGDSGDYGNDDKQDDKPEPEEKPKPKPKKASKTITVVADKRRGGVTVNRELLKFGQEKKLTAEEMQDERLIAQIDAGVRSGLWSVK